jgi:glutamine synthetase
VPGFEAPVRLAYSARNRSAAIRIPVGDTSPKAKRIEVRFPDASSNPYLTFTALLMAAIDGIENKIHPGEPLDKDIYSLPPEELANVPQTPGSLQEAIDALKEDNEFLLKGGVMDMDFINMWIETKQAEQDAIRLVPHPKEFELYFDI